MLLRAVNEDPILDPLFTLSQDLISSNRTFQKLHSLARGKVKRKYRGSTSTKVKTFSPILNKETLNKPIVRNDCRNVTKDGVPQEDILVPSHPIRWKKPKCRLVIRKKVDGYCNRVKFGSRNLDVSLCDKEVQTFSVLLTQSFEGSDSTCLSFDQSVTDSDYDDLQTDSLTQLSEMSFVQSGQTNVKTDVNISAKTNVEADVDISVPTNVETDVDISASGQPNFEANADTSGQRNVETDVNISVQLNVDTSTSVQKNVETVVDSLVQPDGDTLGQPNVETDVDISVKRDVESSVQLNGDAFGLLNVDTSVQANVDIPVQPDVDTLVQFPNIGTSVLVGSNFGNVLDGLKNKQPTSSFSNLSFQLHGIINFGGLLLKKSTASYIVSVVTIRKISLVDIKKLMQDVSLVPVMNLIFNDYLYTTGSDLMNSTLFSHSDLTQCRFPQVSRYKCKHKCEALAGGSTPDSTLSSGTFLGVEPNWENYSNFCRTPEKSLESDLSYSESETEDSVRIDSVQKLQNFTVLYGQRTEDAVTNYEVADIPHPMSDLECSNSNSESNRSGESECDNEEILECDNEEILDRYPSNDDLVAELTLRLESLYITALVSNSNDRFRSRCVKNN
ncbi:hypothetical protein ACHWQZ_G019440 [Mnemiopsis leidyi]